MTTNVASISIILACLIGCVAQTNGVTESVDSQTKPNENSNSYSISRPHVWWRNGSVVMVQFTISNPNVEKVCIDALDTYQSVEFPDGPQKWLARKTTFKSGMESVANGGTATISTFADLYDVVDFYEGAVQASPGLPRYDQRMEENLARIDEISAGANLINLREVGMQINQSFDVYFCNGKHEGRDNVANLRTDLSDIFVLPKQ